MVYSLAVMIFVDDIVMGVSSFQILIYLGDFSALNSDPSVDMNSLSVAWQFDNCQNYFILFF